MKIIYPTQSGIAVITPTGIIPVIQTALSDVPAGVPFCIVQDEAVPVDRSNREAWECDFSHPDGYGANYGAGSEYGVYLRDKSGNARCIKNPAGDELVISTAQARNSVAGITCTGGAEITINLEKAREIAHDIRRRMRDAEFAPLDEAIMKQIPGTDFAAIESQRETVRQKYADMQIAIDAAETVEDLSGIIGRKSAS